MKQVLLTILLYLPISIYAQIISTYAGNGTGSYLGDGGLATSASIGAMGGLAFDKFGNLFLCENNYTIRKISVCGIITKVAGNGTNGFSGDGGLAVDAQLAGGGITCDTFGNIFIADFGNNRIRKIDATSGVITTIAGSAITGFGGDGGPASLATINGPAFICCDKSNNIYFADYNNNRIRKISSVGIISTIAGNGTPGFSGDSGPATSAQLFGLRGLHADGVGNLFVSDNNRIRKINLVTGSISSVAGNGTFGSGGDGGIATEAQLWNPWDVIPDFYGNFFISDDANNRIRKVDLASTITTFVGTGIGTYSGDGIPAALAHIYTPRGLAFDPCGNLYIADNGNSRIRKITINSSPVLPTSVSIDASPSDTICSGETATFHATAFNSGCTSYKWFRNGSLALSGGNTFSVIPTNGDSIRCEVTYTSCSGAWTLNSNSLIMTVIPSSHPHLGITVFPDDTLCLIDSGPVTFSAMGTYTGSSPMYQWKLNGINVGSGGTSYSYIPSTGDAVQCVMTSNADCPVPATVSSNSIFMDVVPFVSSSISLSGTTSVLTGDLVTINATVVTSGSYIVKWMNKGIQFATTTYPEVSFVKTDAVDSITAWVISTTWGCPDSSLSGVHIVVSTDAGIKQSNVVNDVSIYPNPAHDVLNIVGANNAYCRVLNVLGQEVLAPFILQKESSVLASSLPPRAYYLEISDSVHVHRAKFFKE